MLKETIKYKLLRQVWRYSGKVQRLAGNAMIKEHKKQNPYDYGLDLKP